MSKAVLPDAWDVPQVLRDRVGTQAGRQRAMFADGHLLLVLHEPPQVDEDSRSGVFFWRQPDGAWRASNQTNGPDGITHHIAAYTAVVDQYEDLEEAANTAEEYFEVIEHLAPVYRATRNLHLVLQDARKLVPEDRDLINFRDSAYELERTAELLYDVARNSLNFAVAKRAEEQALDSHEMSIAAHRLNLFVAFFFPIATLSAIFSMNLESGLKESVNQPFGWLLVMATGLLCGSVLMLLLIRRRNSGKSMDKEKSPI